MAAILIFGGVILAIGFMILFVGSRRRIGRLTALARKTSRLTALEMSLSSAEHLWLHRSANPGPSIAALKGRDIQTPAALHAALLDSTSQMSLSKSAAPLERARRMAEIRARREDLGRLIPRLEQATSATAPMLDAVLMEAIQSASPGLISDLIAVDVNHNDLVGLLPFHDSIADGVGSAGEHVLHSIANAHIPILTIASSVSRYRAAASNGLDTETAVREGAYEIALRGGGVAAGATIGAHALGTFMPIVGHIVGAGLGALGGWIGGQLNAQRQEQPLRDADSVLRAQLFELGSTLPADAWPRFAEEGWEVIGEGEAALCALESEWDASLSWWRRHVWPSFLDVTCAEALRQGAADIIAERAEAEAFDRLVARMRADTDGQAYLAAAALARPRMRRELGVNDEAFESVTASLEAVSTEREKLALIRG